MKSRTFCCNGTIMKKDFLRGAPLWIVYLLCWLVAMPITLFSQRGWRVAMEVRYLVLEAAVISAHVVPFFYGLGVACLLFSYLYRSRSANFFAALPLRRESLFLTKYLTGLLYLLLPNLVIAIATVLVGAGLGVNLVTAVLGWFAASFLGYLLYFSFAVLCAMVVGHLVALPLLYGVLNFTAIVLEAIVQGLMSLFVYGWYSNGYALTFLSPLWYSATGGRCLMARPVYDDNMSIRIVDCYLEGWTPVLLYAAVGVVFALLAFWMYRKRRMESAGDVIAVRHLKPVFLYCFTVGCSLVIGWLLSSMMFTSSRTANFLPVLLCLLVGAALGYFGGEMMLHKSLRVFRKRNWANCAVACAVIAAVLCCCRFDLFGYSRYVPEAGDVAAVSLGYGEDYSTDAQLIAQVTALHQDIVNQRAEAERALQQESRGVTVYLRYRLQNGKEVSRRYELPVSEDLAARPDSLIRQYEAVYNNPDYIVARTLSENYTQADIRLCDIYYSDYKPYTEGELYLSAAETYTLLKTAVEPDLRDSTMGVRLYTDSYSSVETVSQDYDVSLRIELVNGGWWYLSVSPDAVRTIQALIDLGIPEEVFAQ